MKRGVALNPAQFLAKGRISSIAVAALSLLTGANLVEAAEYQWPAYSPNIAYDFNEDFGPLDPPTKILPGVSGVEGVYADDWWCFVWGADKNPEVTDSAWIPMIDRFNTDFAFMTDIMGWPRDKRAQHGYYSTVYLFGSGLSTDNADNTTPGGWMGTTGWNGEPWHNVLASYIPVKAFDPATPDGYQSGAMIHEGIHSIFANMPGGYNSAWAHESFNVWLQGTMESLRNGSFSGMGGLSVGSQIAPFIPIQCYSGWLQDGTFGGPGGQGVNKAGPSGQICTWRQILGGYQYGEAFPHALEVILGPKSIPWIWNADHSGFLLEDMALAPGGIGDAQARRVIQEYRGRQAFCDFKQWSHAFRQLLHNYWTVSVEEEWAPYDVDVEPWVMTCYVATTNSGGTLTPEARTLPGWSGANQIPLTVDPAATSVSVTFDPIGANMSCQLVYRDTDGAIHYSDPVASGVCELPVSNVLNNVVIAVVCNTDYVYEGEQTRTAKFNYTLDIGTGITGAADIYTKWWDYNPDTYTIAASAGANGSIHPSGAVVADNGAVQTFTFSPAPGHRVGDVLLNGLSVGSPSSYTLNPVLSDLTLEVTFMDATPPAAPAGLGAVAVNGNIDLDWADNGEADLEDYNVYRATTSGGDYSPVASGVSTSNYTDYNVVNGTTYYYVVTAVDTDSNESVRSNEASAVAVDTLAPGAPVGVTASGTGDAAVVRWTANSEPDFGTYAVYRSTSSGGGYVLIASGLTDVSYLDATVVNGMTYYYVVTGSDSSGNESGYSAEATPDFALLAHWDFNDPALGAANAAAVPDSNGYNIWRKAAADKSGNGNDLTTWDFPAAGFTWSTNSEDGDFSIKSAGDYPAAMTWSSQSPPGGMDVEQFTGAAFTVEALATVSGTGYTRTVLGRDARDLASSNGAMAALYLGLDGGDHARFQYVDVNGKAIELLSTTTYPADDNVFRHFAATSDGSTVSLYVDGALVARATNAGMAGLGKGTTSGSGFHAGGWSVARGLYDSNHVDRWFGYIDSVSITATALGPGGFVLSDVVSPGDPAPAAPTGLTATANDGTVDLDWADNTEPDFNYYTVYRSTSPGGGYAPVRVGLTTSSYTDPRADNGTTFYYVVTATDTALGESDFSAAASADPVDVTPPASPAGLSASAGNGAVSLYWNDNTDPDFASYTVHRSTTSGSGYAAVATGLTISAYVDNTVENGATYYYVVTAVDTSALESSNSSEVSATATSSEILGGTVIGTPGSWDGFSTIDKVFDGDLGTYYDAVNASGAWAGLDLGSPQQITLVKYAPRGGFAYRMVGGRFEGSNSANFTSGVVTLFTIGAQPADGVLTEQVISDPGTYRYVRYIGPTDGHCNVAEVEFHTAAAADTTPPSAPTGLVATPGANSVSLDWVNNTEPDLAGYTVYRSTTSGSGFAAIASGLVASSHTDNSATNGTTYYYVVSAKDSSANESSNSSEVSATPADVSPPLAPTGLVATAGNHAVDLDWNDNLEHDLASYTVYRSTTSGSGYAPIATGLAVSDYADSSAANGTTYYYVVTATDAVSNESVISGEVSATPTAVVAGVSLSTSTPAVGDGVQNLNFSTSVLDNTQHQFVPSNYIGTQYRGDDLQMGQSFTTGSNGDGYTLTSVSVRQVSWGPTDWDYDGGSVTLRIFDLSAAGPGAVWYATQMASETASVSGSGSPTVAGTPASPRWLTFTLATPVALNPGTQYAFAIGSTGGLVNQEFFMNLDGTATDSYAGGFSLSVPEAGVDMWDGGNGQPSDRAFVAAMTAVDTTHPAAPTGLAASATQGSVELDWDDSLEPDLASYTVHRSTTSGSGYSSVATGLASSSYTDNTVGNGITYYYVVTATDTAANTSSNSSEAAATPMTPAQSWRFTQFGTIDNVGDAADNSDPENDGIMNIMERAFGGNPHVADPQILPEIDATMPMLSIRYRVAMDATDLTFEVQENGDLRGTWLPATGSEVVVGEEGNIRTVRFTRPAGAEDVLFLRLKVDEP